MGQTGPWTYVGAYRITMFNLHELRLANIGTLECKPKNRQK